MGDRCVDRDPVLFARIALSDLIQEPASFQDVKLLRHQASASFHTGKCGAAGVVANIRGLTHPDTVGSLVGKKSKRQKRIPPQDIYVNALSFYVATMAMSQPEVARGVDKLLLYWPTVVCEAFSLELFLKCLHAVRRRQAPRHHDPAALFHDLSKADRKAIDGYFQEAVKLHFQYPLALQHGLSFDIESVLQRTKDTFVRVRYWHEQQRPNADASGKVSNAGVGSLCGAIKRLLDELRPEWGKMILNIPVLLENLPPPNSQHGSTP